ncbi:PQQ-binding-like beta-propeller repeat protein [Natrononativus amylolyticus]|uniref:outer membrane protein assembly factor BamB family protein n=1 Tax=Natrononativus amylolyticus TaxID=2963434 RepID=UPI0020CD9D63|nr:PQQ-binding-like beta-propeller repeat protein [Natrononativus amylolyticus]
MSGEHRRGFLKKGAGAAIIAGGLFTATGVGSDDDVGIDLPDPELIPNPDTDEDWADSQADAGNGRTVENGYEFDGERLEVAWAAEHYGGSGIAPAGMYGGGIAVADDTVYTAGEEGVAAIDDEDGSVRWKNGDVDAREPTVVDDTIYLSGDEVVALDRTDGSVRWETDLEPEDGFSPATVAYGGVYALGDGTLYALDPADGTTTWRRDTVEHEDEHWETEEEFATYPAAANGVVYASTNQLTVALEPETGEAVWKERTGSHVPPGPTRASATMVAAGGGGYTDWGACDAQTGERVGGGTGAVGAVSDEVCVIEQDDSVNVYDAESGERLWSLYTHGNSTIPTLSGDTAYIYFNTYNATVSSAYDGKLVAFDADDGTEKWVLSLEDERVGTILAVSGETMYVYNNGEIVALREDASDDEEESGDDEGGEDEQDGDESDDEDDGDEKDDGEDDEDC